MLALVALGCIATLVGTFIAGALSSAGKDARRAAQGSKRTAQAERERSTAATITPAESPTPPEEISQPATLTIAAAGDMIFDRKVGALVRAQGGAAPLARVASLLADADVTVGNLESPLSSVGSAAKGKDVTFRGEPAGIAGLKRAGFDFLSMANNHALDYGPDALEETISLLDGAGIRHAGAGMDREAAWEPAVLQRGSTSIAFLSFSHILPPGFIATSTKAGIANGRSNMDDVTEAIRAAKKANDYVIVSFHWGIEYDDDANADQVRDAHAAVDAGADMVLSHHPHVIQGVERYRKGLVAYSLGDFVFDHYSRKTGEAFILNAELGPNGVGEVTFTPVYLDTSGRPDVVSGEEADVILQRLSDISAPLGGAVRVRGDQGVLQ